MRALRKILVPIDFSTCSEAALEQAVFFARRFGAAVEVMHVWRPNPIDAMNAQSPDAFRVFALSQAGHSMRQLLERWENCGVEVLGRLESGDPARVVVDLSMEYDLIVLGTNGGSGVAHFLRGQITERIVRQSLCPVLTVHAHMAEDVPVRVPTAGIPVQAPP